MNYGLALMSRGKLEEAEKYFRKALKYVPRYAYLYVNLGIVEAATGRPEEAEISFKKAIMLNPRWPDGYYWYAHFLKKQQRYGPAIRFAQKALDLSSANLDARRLLMTIYRETGRFIELKALARQTLRIFPGDAQAARDLAVAEKRDPSLR
jgi:tetratricopeptide (TPR) repeat protein